MAAPGLGARKRNVLAKAGATAPSGGNPEPLRSRRTCQLAAGGNYLLCQDKPASQLRSLLSQSRGEGPFTGEFLLTTQYSSWTLLSLQLLLATSRYGPCPQPYKPPK
ncbi:hypothetical protein H671_1g3559 [Cricetulus griseus]|uniref:Uncharacterized protein n=1 Tax=Cricetulus griseus TaxID=10029 RepID=A0A061IL43_CRIGR|nr:hypothetical protein H671_1g3559 [Cricetulus griseus]